jgi:hypothetical protein
MDQVGVPPALDHVLPSLDVPHPAALEIVVLPAVLDLTKVSLSSTLDIAYPCMHPKK